MKHTFLISEVDSLYVGDALDVASSDLDFESLLMEKALARDDAGVGPRMVQVGLERFEIRPSGSYPYALTLRNCAFTIKLARRMQPAVYVQYSSEALGSEGASALDARIRAWAEDLRMVAITPDVVSRVDVAFDYPLPDPVFDQTAFVSRAGEDAVWRGDGRPETFLFGRGDVVIRVYDKAKEISEASGKTWFCDLWGHDAGIWRIEVQIRSGRLREAGLRTFSDLHERFGDVVLGVLTDHTTLRAPPADRNRSCWPIHPLWADVQNRAAHMPRLGVLKKLRVKNALGVQRADRLNQILGYFPKLAAIQTLIKDTGGAMTFEETLSLFRRAAQDRFHHADWKERVLAPIDAYEAGQW